MVIGQYLPLWIKFLLSTLTAGWFWHHCAYRTRILGQSSYYFITDLSLMESCFQFSYSPHNWKEKWKVQAGLREKQPWLQKKPTLRKTLGSFVWIKKIVWKDLKSFPSMYEGLRSKGWRSDVVHLLIEQQYYLERRFSSCIVVHNN